jgi:hypothetical protein
MTSRAQRNQVIFRVVTTSASKVLVVYLEIGHAAALLAMPAVTPKNPLMQDAVAGAI